ncbi:hypothetical protein EMIT0194P_60142 [Pseudomonas serbica]
MILRPRQWRFSSSPLSGTGVDAGQKVLLIINTESLPNGIQQVSQGYVGPMRVFDAPIARSDGGTVENIKRWRKSCVKKLQ